MSEDKVLSVLMDIRNWTRAASYASVKTLLEAALPDSKTRSAYQMLDGSATMEQVRVACKMSPNALVALAQKWNSPRIRGASGYLTWLTLVCWTTVSSLAGTGRDERQAKEGR